MAGKKMKTETSPSPTPWTIIHPKVTLGSRKLWSKDDDEFIQDWLTDGHDEGVVNVSMDCGVSKEELIRRMYELCWVVEARTVPLYERKKKDPLYATEPYVLKTEYRLPRKMKFDEIDFDIGD